MEVSSNRLVGTKVRFVTQLRM